MPAIDRSLSDFRYLIRAMRKLGYTNIVQSRPLGLHKRMARRKWTDSGLLILSRLPIETQDDMLFPEEGIGLDAGTICCLPLAAWLLGDSQLVSTC